MMPPPARMTSLNSALTLKLLFAYANSRCGYMRMRSYGNLLIHEVVLQQWLLFFSYKIVIL